MSDINDGGPAFPRPFSLDRETEAWSQDGMSLRDYFAAHVLPAVYAHHVQTGGDDQEVIAEEAYELADALIAARATGKGAR